MKDTASDGEVTWIADGDTIDVEGSEGPTTVRLVGINAPDRGECYAEVGLDHLIDSLKGEQVTLEVTGEDQFGRTLAHVFTGDRHVNLEMVASGLALASTPDDTDPYRQSILSAESEAFATSAGLWSATACGSDSPIPKVAIDPARSIVDPPGPDDQDLTAEVLVVVNEGAEIVDLTGWILRDESTRHRFTFPSGTTIGPGERVTISSSDHGWDPGDSPVWNNGGDMALLQMPDGTVVGRWRY